jgi:hypothetical protein
MRITRLNWKPIVDQASRVAESLGHQLGPFTTHRNRFGSGNVVRTATCNLCGGCCWIAFSERYGAGGRLLKYRCGTPEAMGLLRDGSACA